VITLKVATEFHGTGGIKVIFYDKVYFCVCCGMQVLLIRSCGDNDYVVNNISIANCCFVYAKLWKRAGIINSVEFFGSLRFNKLHSSNFFLGRCHVKA
jgi:hypothetical protein